MSVPLVALHIKHPKIGDAIMEGQRHALGMERGELQNKRLEMQSAQEAIQMLSGAAMSAMGGDPNGQPDPQKWEEALDMLEQAGYEDAGMFRGKAAAAPMVVGTSMTALQQLQVAQNEKQMELTIKRLDMDMQRLAEGIKPTFTKPVQAINEAGEPVFVQTSDTGEVREVEGYSPNNPIKTLNTGTEQVIVDSRTGNVISRTSIENEQKAYDTAKGGEQGKQDAKQPERKRKAKATLNSLSQQWKLVTEDIDKAIEQAGTFTTGFGGSVLKAVPGTEAYDLRNTLLTIQANIGFDKLQDMRNNSPTGGALGQVSEFENRLLQSVQGALEQSQTKKQLVDNLERVKVNLKNLAVDRQRAFEETYGQEYQSPNAPISRDERIVEVPDANVAGKSRDNPIPVETIQQAEGLPKGTYFVFEGRVGRVD